DTLVALDFVQAVIVCVAAYLYFFYLPMSDSRGALAHAVWAPYFVGSGFVAGSFLLRAIITRSGVARALFGRFGAFLVISSICDGLYYYGPGRNLKTGAWFDIIWSTLLMFPLALALTWKQAEAPHAPLHTPKPEKKIHTELLRAERQGQQVGLIMADVDHFKSVNDSRGHVAGDLVLRIIGSEVASVVRPYDSVGRYGGEEFLIVAPNCGNSATWELAERVR